MNTAAQPVVQGRFVVPEVVATHFHVKPDDVVADFGAGSGYFTSVLSRLVGPDGRVFACDIQKHLVETVSGIVYKQGLENVDVLWCDLEAPRGSRLESDSADAVLMVNTLFQIEDKPAVLAEALRVLRPGGTLLLIDWSESFQGLGPPPDQIVDENTARALLETAGFTVKRTFDAGDHHYGVAAQI